MKVSVLEVYFYEVYLRRGFCGVVEQGFSHLETLCPLMFMVQNVLKCLHCSGGPLWKRSLTVEDAGARRGSSRLPDLRADLVQRNVRRLSVCVHTGYVASVRCLAVVTSRAMSTVCV